MSARLPSLPDDCTTTRLSLHVVAARVLARRRAAATGRFGLRATPGGFGTPAYEIDGAEEALRVAGTDLVRERRQNDGATATTRLPLPGTSLAALADFAGVDLDPSFSVGKDTPTVADPTAPLEMSSSGASVVAEWLHLGAIALDRFMDERGADATPSVVQLWPEHFDIACDLTIGRFRVNVGASVGDGYCVDPYVYFGPRHPDRPGDPSFWNQSFGASRPYADVARADDPIEDMLEFFDRGCAQLTG